MHYKYSTDYQQIIMDQEKFSQRPWTSTNGAHRIFYPQSTGKQTGFSLFATGVDRFIIVDHYDLWAMVETGKILSSKFSPMVYIIDNLDSDLLTNERCLEYTTKDKKSDVMYGGALVYSHKQSSTLRRIKSTNIISAGLPPDYENPCRYDALKKLQDYALFTLRCVYAVNLANEFRNFFPETFYKENYFNKDLPSEFNTRPDTTESPIGMSREIKSILYHTASTEDALEQIHNVWRLYSKKDISGYRQDFYSILGIPEPEDLRAIGKPGQFNKDFHESTIGVI